MKLHGSFSDEEHVADLFVRLAFYDPSNYFALAWCEADNEVLCQTIGIYRHC